MKEQDRTYQRLLSFSTGFKNRFALLLARSSHFDVRREWQARLAEDLGKKNIQMVHVRGDELPDELVSITAFIQMRVPTTDRWILSLSHFDYHMMPTFSNKLGDKDLLAGEYRPGPTPSAFVQRLNVERDAFVKTFPVPVIFWASDAAVRQMAEHAPDFYDFRQFIIDLPRPDELRTFPNIPRASFVKMLKPEPLAKEIFQQLDIEREQLQSRRRRAPEESRRYIDILSELASSQHADGNGESGLAMLQTALNEAVQLNLPEEQARLHEQSAYLYYSLNQQEQALSHQEKAIALYRIIAQKDGNLYLPGLVNALNRKAILLSEISKPIAAREIFEETIDNSRVLFEKEPEIRAPLLAEVLNNAARLLTEVGKLDEAETHYKEAVDLYRRLPNKRYRILLALVLNNWGNLMAAMNRLDEALPLHQEALQIRRLYFSGDPGKYRADLSQSLYNLSLLMGEIGNFQQAKYLFEEALEVMSYLPDKGFELLGCGDNQAQMHGFRIELGEIEASIVQHPAVKEALVIVREDEPGKKRLTAYVIIKEGNYFEANELQSFLREKLPEYIIPSAFVVLPQLPLAPNGKVDRKELPKPKKFRSERREERFTQPRTDIEKTLCGIWEELLGVRPISVTDDFFELGGDSIKVLRMLNRIREIFTAAISALDFFNFPTIAGIARIVEENLMKEPEVPAEIPGTL